MKRYINRPVKSGHHVLRDRDDDNRRAFCTECNQVVKTWKKADRFRCSIGQQSKKDAFRENNPGYNRDYWLKKMYNISLEEYNELLASQNSVCAICKQPEKVARNNLAVDHDHACCPRAKRSCGKCIRGLLCWNCNTSLGKMELHLEAMIVYLRKETPYHG